MSKPKKVAPDEAVSIDNSYHIDWSHIEPERAFKGLFGEMSCRSKDSGPNTADDLMRSTGRIALAQLREFPAFPSCPAMPDLEGDGC